MRLAIVEADPAAADLLMFVAQRRGHQPVCVPHVERLAERLPFEPTCILLSLPELDAGAIEAIQLLKETFTGITVLLIVERAAPMAPISALKAGAQDVVTSPYNPFEVVYRAETWAAARSAPGTASSAIRLADLEIDLDLFVATKAGKSLPLTKLERRLLYCIGQHYPNVAPIERLLSFGWESLDEPDAALLKTHISHIRKKLRDAGGVLFEIISQQTVGYSLALPESERKAS
ncbi:MAG: response regulator transcription factor [Dehalococcoidia bacterium]|nr:response regulator transcription factor [Dehalococcoidia bacterium]